MQTSDGLKVCFKCSEAKAYSEFYRHKMMADGHLGKCKSCTKRDVTNHREANLDRFRAYDSNRFKNNPIRREKIFERARAYARMRPKARAAHYAVSNAIRDGKMESKGCEICGKKAAAHHDDYDKPLEVRWLCPPHHQRWHRDNGPGKNRD